MINTRFEQWLNYADDIYRTELHEIQGHPVEIEDRFYQTVPFGTGGMRGLLGAGTNRMNIHTIRLVAEGLSRQIESQGKLAKVRGVVIAYDTRNFSQVFAYETASVLAKHGIQTYVFKESRPTPELSFAVRYLNAIAGVVITASHNPKQYNGFKVYGEDGAQLTPQFADEIVVHMNEVEDIFSIQYMQKEELLSSSFCTEILEQVDDAYAAALKTLQQRDVEAKDVRIVYTPLHGAGLVPTIRALSDVGFSKVSVVEEQSVHDGSFPTVVYPNPEEHAAFELAIKLGKKTDAELLLATDPDADRLGVAVKSKDDYKLLTGNQLGGLLLYYILTSKKETGLLPDNGVMIKTIVTSELGTAIANSFGVSTVNTLTGFKYIAEKIAEYEHSGKYSYLFGYEESYGYLAGNFVRDKDAIQIALLTAEMAAYYKEQGLSLLDALVDIYKQFGFHQEKLLSYTFEGMEGQRKILSIMEMFRLDPPQEFAGVRVNRFEDYLTGRVKLVDGGEEQLTLPKANVIKLILEDDSWICIRPSGTEPKCKIYLAVVDREQKLSSSKIDVLECSIEGIMESYLNN